MALLSSLLTQLRAVLPGRSSRRPSSAQHPRRRFHPHLEPLEPRAMLSGCHHTARHVPPVRVFDGTYRVFVLNLPRGFPGFDVRVNNGQITAPPAVQGVTVFQNGQVVVTGEDKVTHTVHACVEGKIRMILSTGLTGRGSYLGKGTLFLDTNEAKADGTWQGRARLPNGSISPRFHGAWNATRIAP